MTLVSFFIFQNSGAVFFIKLFYFSQITKRKFHYYPKGAFADVQPRDPSDIPEISSNYCYAVRRSGGPLGRRTIYQRLTSCPCANCLQGYLL